MKLLFDQNLSHRLCKAVYDLFPDSTQVGTLGLATSDDETIWRYAKEHGFTLVSHDSDFAELAALGGSPPKVVWLRCGNQPTKRIEALLRANYSALIAFEDDPDASCMEIYEEPGSME